MNTKALPTCAAKALDQYLARHTQPENQNADVELIKAILNDQEKWTDHIWLVHRIVSAELDWTIEYIVTQRGAGDFDRMRKYLHMYASGLGAIEKVLYDGDTEGVNRDMDPHVSHIIREIALGTTEMRQNDTSCLIGIVNDYAATLRNIDNGSIRWTDRIDAIKQAITMYYVLNSAEARDCGRSNDIRAKCKANIDICHRAADAIAAYESSHKG